MTDTSITILIVALCLSFSPLVSSQDSWDDEGAATSWGNPSPESTPPDQATSSFADPDATYIIKKGDTLWDLAFQFLGDPFMWPQIWQANSYITNPDLIYPGNRLVIPGRQTVGNPPETFTSETNAALDENAAIKDTLENSSEFPSDSLLLELMNKKEILSEEYLANVPFLWTERDTRGNMFPGNAVVAPPPAGAAYQLYSIVSITPYQKALYNINDTVALYASLRFVRFNDKPANLIKRTGSAVITKIGDQKIDALLFAMSDPVVGKERVMPTPRLQPRRIDTLISPSTAITAKVFCRVEETQSPYPYQMIILDVGSTQGVELGDVFGIYHLNKDESPARLSVIGSIGHVGNGSSTLNMIIMSDNHIEKGDRAVLLRRAKFE